ncbi:Cyclopropane-fatty-acyl-phospholipid synthase [Pyrenophora seminiperda CCB06]|uniref:Cyclopropane-fatty-acyl-phospholipid synthase n=1 Tax=Pyrenophora seminiperda CCB06 TaxID=1302712 RepID=A0A3M7MHN3_9PLEO|nr:Cyclopropane-fatty-acyl-phospholipid synthase [Pyrenophora seminiperda CCB06]
MRMGWGARSSEVGGCLEICLLARCASWLAGGNAGRQAGVTERDYLRPDPFFGKPRPAWWPPQQRPENALRHLQPAAAAKSLHAGTKAPKTPFKIPLNDENAVNAAGKSALQTKGKGNDLFAAKNDKNAFMTPAGPRMRAPLGMKTTNAKSKAFATPAPLPSTKTQKLSPRLRRPKVKVHQPEAAQESGDDVPEVEYMPPKEIPLQDDMDEYLPKGWTMPKLSDRDMARGIWQAYHNPVEDDGRTREQRRFEEEIQRDRKKRHEQFEKIFAAQMAKDDAETREYYGIKAPKGGQRLPTTSSALRKAPNGPSTMRARSAAVALASESKPSYAAPTAAAKSRLPTGIIAGRKGAKTPTELTAVRQASAATASKSTIGYAQGRAGRSALAARKPLSNVTKPAPFSTTSRPISASHNRSASTNMGTARSRGPMSRCSSTSTNATLVSPPDDEQLHRTAEDMEREMELLLLSQSDDDEDEAWMQSFSNQLHAHDPFDEDSQNFQFQLPNGF